jgi:cardiolipin synthase
MARRLAPVRATAPVPEAEPPPVSEVAPGAFSEGAMERAAGARAVAGNTLGLQFEGPTTFDRWLEAIEAARHSVLFENYILRNDRIGRRFREALVAKAREGVPVRVVYDWLGCWATPRRYWKPFREAGIELRAFNRPELTDPLGVTQRDHRKLVCVDAEVAFVGGFCVGEEWAGTSTEPPWRDTGVEIRGPAAAAVARAFGRTWAEMGPALPDEFMPDPSDRAPAGTTPVWVIEGEPGRSRVYRTLTLVAAHAQRRLWITDPYFVAPRPVFEALAEAARSGVDVRVLVPAHNNWPWVGSLSRTGYRDLLAAGVRLFEWQGPMIHAKTSVADGLWCRVGSSNLNAYSLLGNWELDVGVLDRDLASQLEGLFLADLASSVEIVLPSTHVVVPREPVAGERRPPTASLEPEGTIPERIERELRSRIGGLNGPRTVTPSGSAGWRIADLVRAGSVFGDALAGRRPLGREDRTVLGTISAIVLVVAVAIAFAPAVAGWTLAALLGWVGVTGSVRAWLARRRARARARAEAQRAGAARSRLAGSGSSSLRSPSAPSEAVPHPSSRPSSHPRNS